MSYLWVLLWQCEYGTGGHRHWTSWTKVSSWLGPSVWLWTRCCLLWESELHALRGCFPGGISTAFAKDITTDFPVGLWAYSHTCYSGWMSSVHECDPHSFSKWSLTISHNLRCLAWPVSSNPTWTSAGCLAISASDPVLCLWPGKATGDGPGPWAPEPKWKTPQSTDLASQGKAQP